MTDAPSQTFRRRIASLACVLLGALALMSTAFAAGRPSVFFDTDGYYLMGENLAQVLKRAPAVLAGDRTALTTPVSDDDQIDIAVMGARSPVYGLFLFGFERLGGIWLVAGVQALIAAWTLYLLWKAAAPRASPWGYAALTAALAACSTLPFFATFIMPDVFSGVAAVGLVLLVVYGERLSRLETAGVVLLLALAYAVHTSHVLTALAALVPAALMLLWLRAPRRRWLTGMGLALGAMVLATGAGKGYDAAFLLRTGHALHRPPFLMARVLADGPGREYLHKVCQGRDDPYVICRATLAPLTRSDDILWEESPLLGAFNALNSPALQLRMEAEEGAFVKAAVLNDPLGQVRASLGNWLDQLTRLSSHDPLRDPRQFLANEYWKTTRLVDLIVDPRRCKPIGSGCRPPFDVALTKHWHELMVLLSLTFLCWRFSRPDVRAGLGRGDRWTAPAAPVLAAAVMLVGMAVLNAGVCGVLSGAFSRYQARIVWIVPAAAALTALRLGLALPARAARGLRRLSGQAAPGA